MAVSLTALHAGRALSPEIFWYSFLLAAEWTPESTPWMRKRVKLSWNIFVLQKLFFQAESCLNKTEGRLTSFSLSLSLSAVSVENVTLLSWALLEGPPLVQPRDTFPAFYGTRRFIITFTRVHYLSLSWARLIRSTLPASYLSKIQLNIIHPPTSWSS
jgi:hypothetical protein